MFLFSKWVATGAADLHIAIAQSVVLAAKARTDFAAEVLDYVDKLVTLVVFAMFVALDRAHTDLSDEELVSVGKLVKLAVCALFKQFSILLAGLARVCPRLPSFGPSCLECSGCSKLS